MIKSILVAVDGSDHSRRALEMACDLTSRYQAKLTIVNVAEPNPNAELVWGGTSISLGTRPGEQSKTAKKIVETAAEMARDKGIEGVETVVFEREPAESILDFARKGKTDLIVMGSRGLSRLKGLLVGSVSNKVTQLAPCAVLTVR
jgi:nucleotide-binding universal stress UspA family protein